MPAYDPIQAKFSEVIRDFRANLNNDKLYDEIRKFKSAEDVYEATDKLQADQAINGRLRHLSKIGPFLARMEDYSEAIKAFVQGKPDILAFIWGPIRLLLQWTSILKQSFDAIINTTAEIGDLLPEFLEVTKLFSQNAPLKDVLAFFFQDILDFYLVALQFFSKSRWELLFEAVWPRKRDKIKLVLAHITRHTMLLRNEVRLEHIRDEHQARLEALAHFEKSEKANIRQEHEIIRNMLSPKTYDDKLNWYYSRVCEGTSQWLMTESTFTQWLDIKIDTTKPLWLKGIPGSGKTFLTGAIIDKSKLIGRTAFAFLSHAYTNNTTALSVLHSLIFQLTYDDLDLQTILCHTSRDNIGNSVAVASSVLSTLLASLDTAYIVIDGLDEIDKVERGILLNHIIDISKTRLNVRMMISSRTESDIVAKADSFFASIQVNDHNSSSIQAFVTKKTRDFLDSRQFREEEKAEIEALLAPVAQKAKGMFLYAKVLLDCVEFLHDVESVRAELRVLPHDLHDAYHRILLKLNSLRSPVARQNARQILGWIGCSPSPLTVKEIEQALMLKPSYETTVLPVKASLNIVELCGPIVEVENGYIYDKDIDGHVNLTGSMLDLTIRCIYYLCTECFDMWLTPEDLTEQLLSGSYRLHYYTMTYWFELVMQAITLHGPETPPPGLVIALQTLLSVRSHYDMSAFPLSSDQPERPELDDLEQHDPEIVEMLRHISRFNRQLSGSSVHLHDIDEWKWPAPLTTTHTSRQVHESIDTLLCCTSRHIENCNCEAIKHHYSSSPFKCGYLECPSFRHGFTERKARDSHEKLHLKPWKCDEPTCEYAEIGFLSQRMRDNHNSLHQQVQKPQNGVKSATIQDDSLLDFMVDLIQLDKVSEIESLCPLFATLHKISRKCILRSAISHGGASPLDILLRPTATDLSAFDIICLLAHSIREKNMEAVRMLHPKINKSRRVFSLYSYRMLLVVLLVADSAEAREACNIMQWDWNLYRPLKYDERDAKIFIEAAFHYNVVFITKEYRDREPRLISFWTALLCTSEYKVNISDSDKQSLIGRALMQATDQDSIPLSKVLLAYGANIDWCFSISAETPLGTAAWIDSKESAKMKEFLLYHGADHQSQYGESEIKISERKGTNGIAKWLGVSWEELVERVNADRARGYCPPEYRLDSDES